MLISIFANNIRQLEIMSQGDIIQDIFVVQKNSNSNTKLLLLDSCLQHLPASFDSKSTALASGNKLVAQSWTGANTVLITG